MQIREIGAHYLLRLEAEDEVIQSLETWADRYDIGFAAVIAIGALQRAKLGFFDAEESTYHYMPVDEQVEVLALNGNVSRGEDGEPIVHVHAVLGQEDGQTMGGHLAEGIVFPTLEVVLLPMPGEVQRRHDPATGLVLWDLE